MTAQTNQPAKFLVPFAQNDSSRVELPVTTSDATRASQSLGFPPATMQPPEAGGVPPQGEDFNGAMNQVARIAWWLMLGGEFAFDNAFATAAQIGGYPKGAVLQSADSLGNWISTTDNNTGNPDTSTDPAGGGYVPGYQYGTTALTGLTGGTVTLTNAQAAKSAITLAGALTSALTIIVPTWLKNWTVTNNTSGAFAATVKTAAGAGIVVPQNGSPTVVVGNGASITQPAQNVPAATSPAHAVPMSQAAGVIGASRSLTANVAVASATMNFMADEIIVETALGGTRYCLSSLNQSVSTLASGIGGVVGAPLTAPGYAGVYAAYNPSTGAQGVFLANANAALPNVAAAPPAGWAATALISVWPIDASGRFVQGYQVDRTIYLTSVSAPFYTTTTPVVAYTSLNVANVIPANARRFSGVAQAQVAGATSSIGLSIAGSSTGIGGQTIQAGGYSGTGQTIGNFTVPLITPQTLFYTASAGGGTSPTFSMFASAYEI